MANNKTPIDLNKALNETDFDLDEKPISFGKHKGLTPTEIAEVDPQYLIWAYETFELKPCSYLLYEACRLDEEENEEFLGVTDIFDYMRNNP